VWARFTRIVHIQHGQAPGASHQNAPQHMQHCTVPQLSEQPGLFEPQLLLYVEQSKTPHTQSVWIGFSGSVCASGTSPEQLRGQRIGCDIAESRTAELCVVCA
jgi:hypothetical protein